jgi:hypothetical protein
VNFVLTVRPEDWPVAVSVKDESRFSSVGENSLFRMLPYSSASADSSLSSREDDSSWMTSLTVSPAAQPEPKMTTVSPGL